MREGKGLKSGKMLFGRLTWTEYVRLPTWRIATTAIINIIIINVWAEKECSNLITANATNPFFPVPALDR